LSIGDYVLTGGELPALVILDAVARFVPGVVGDEQSVAEDSFSRGLLDFPQYTRPAEIASGSDAGSAVDGGNVSAARDRTRKVREGDKERIQIFEGVVIGLHRGGTRASFTVRKVSFGQGVERIFPLHSPTIQKVEVTRSAKVRRAKLYYLRDLKGKAARMKDT